MAKVFITGSADGLGQLTAKLLMEQGHQIVLHARNAKRASDALKLNPGAELVLTGDLSNLDETINLAHEANKLGKFDAVIHNAGLYHAPAQDMFAVNVLAPYILTCLMQKPQRLIYLSSGMHLQGHSKLESLKTDISRISYSDSKLHVLMLSKAAARKWAYVSSNAVNPGWVPTRMGGIGAPDDLKKGCETQVWLAVSDHQSARVSGRYFFHQKEERNNSEADDVDLQERLLAICKEITGISFP